MHQQADKPKKRTPTKPLDPTRGNGRPATVSEIWDKALLNAQDVARVLSLPVSTVLQLHEDRKLRGYKVGKYLVWKPEDVRKFAENVEPDD